jgi:glycosyltransferase involved in cell wall biosynthesis
MVEKVIRLSVIVPFFKVKRYAAENVTSLVHNAHQGIKFVLVDDGSTDATSSIVAGAGERLPVALGGRLVSQGSLRKPIPLFQACRLTRLRLPDSLPAPPPPSGKSTLRRRFPTAGTPGSSDTGADGCWAPGSRLMRL